MINEMLSKTREITALAKMTPRGDEPIGNFLRGVSAVLNCGICLYDLNDGLLYKCDEAVAGFCPNMEVIYNSSSLLNDHLLSYVLLPVICKGKQRATLFLGKKEAFTDFDAALADLATVIIGQELQRDHELEEGEDSRRKKSVRQAIEALSYSEKEAFGRVVGDLVGNEGVLIASKIAEREGIKRSAIVNAIRKLESAGVIESRSLGVKGTFIRVVNPILFSAIKKMEA